MEFTKLELLKSDTEEEEIILEEEENIEEIVIEESEEGVEEIESNYHVCSQCFQTFPDSFLLENHEKLQHRPRDKRFSCSHCPKKFKFLSLLKPHERGHTGEKPYKCSHCYKAFTRPDSLKKHNKTHNASFQSDSVEVVEQEDFGTHEDLPNDTEEIVVEYEIEEETNYHVCSQCFQTFSDSGLLEKHVKLNHPIVQSRESSDGKEDVGPHEDQPKITLVDHLAPGWTRTIKTRNFGKTAGMLDFYVYPPDGTMLRSDNEITSYLKKNNMEEYVGLIRLKPENIPARSFPCTICEKSFPDLSSLHEHRSAKPHKCGHCNTAFTHFSTLQAHECDVRRKEKSFACRHCKVTFSRLCNAKTHEMTCHARKKPQECNGSASKRPQNSGEQDYRRKHEKEMSTNKPATNKSKVAGDSRQKSGYKCTICKEKINDKKEVSVSCDKCQEWTHSDCLGLSKAQLNEFNSARKLQGKKWECPTCMKASFGLGASLDTKEESVPRTETKSKEKKTVKGCISEKSKKSSPATSKSFKAQDSARTAPTTHKIARQNGSRIKLRKPFTCTYCKKSLTSLFNLQRHERIHTGEKPYKCSHCNMAFGDQSQHKYHVETLHGNKSYNQPKRFKSQGKVQKDESNQSKNLKNRGKVQKDESNQSKNLKNRVKVQKDESNQSKSLKNRGKVDKNKSNQSKSLKNQRKMQKDESIQPKSLESQGKVHADTISYSCIQCYESFSSISDLKIHEKGHPEEKTFTCSTCKKTFSRLVHVGDKRNGSVAKPTKCSRCKLAFAQKGKQVKSASRPFACKLCSKRFKTSEYLSVHQRVHSGERPYSCRQCKKTFKYLIDLKRHELLHSGERPYQCSRCKKTFTRNYYLKVHEAVHKK